MDLVEVRLNSFLYHFRRLTWIEESTIKTPEAEDARTFHLARALHDVSGMPVTSTEDAVRIIRAIPRTLRRRIWVIYRGNLPPDRSFAMKGLFEAPEPQEYNKQLTVEAEATDKAFDAAARRYGVKETREMQAVEQQMLDNAWKKRREYLAAKENPQKPPQRTKVRK